MNLPTHIFMGLAFLVIAYNAGWVTCANPLVVATYLLGCTIPDIDLLLGYLTGGEHLFRFHRRGTHTVLFALLFGLMLAVLAWYAKQAPLGVTGGLFVFMLVVVVIYYKGDWRAGVNSLLWVIMLTCLYTLEIARAHMGEFAAPTEKELFLAGFCGVLTHIAGDLMAASGYTRMSVLWPLPYKLGIRVVRTSGWSERFLYFCLVSGVTYYILMHGAHLREVMLALVPATSLQTASLAVALLVGFLAMCTYRIPQFLK